MRYEGFTSQDRLDELLDKIKKYGLSSISTKEKEFLDSHKSGNPEEIHKKLNYLENEILFEDDSGRFKFEFKEIEDFGDETHIIGTLYVPDLEFDNGKKINGRIDGRIVVFSNGSTSPDFFINQDYDVFDLIEGLEHEFDIFIDYVVNEIGNKEF
jgi:hypothetical protein